MEMGPFEHPHANRALILPGEDRMIRFPIQVPVTDASLPFDIDMHVVADDEMNIMICDEMRLRRRPGGPPITSAALRTVPVREIVQEISERCAESLRAADAGEWNFGAGVSDTATVRPRRRGARMLLDADLPEVAEVWRAASVSGSRATTLAVKDHFNVSRPTAARAVQRARAAGFIPEV